MHSLNVSMHFIYIYMCVCVCAHVSIVANKLQTTASLDICVSSLVYRLKTG